MFHSSVYFLGRAARMLLAVANGVDRAACGPRKGGCLPFSVGALWPRQLKKIKVGGRVSEPLPEADWLLKQEIGW